MSSVPEASTGCCSYIWQNITDKMRPKPTPQTIIQLPDTIDLSHNPSVTLPDARPTAVNDNGSNLMGATPHGHSQLNDTSIPNSSHSLAKPPSLAEDTSQTLSAHPLLTASSLPTPIETRPTADGSGLPPLETTITRKYSDETVQSTSWGKALAKLTEKERQVLDGFATKLQDFTEEIETVRSLGDNCTNKLSRNSGGACVLTRGRVYNILKKMEQFAAVGDIAVKASPEPMASLVWTGVRFCLQVALNDMQTFDAISSALDDIAGIMGSCAVYDRIHSSRDLQSSQSVIKSISPLYTAVLKFMAEAITFSNEKSLARVGKGVLTPFADRFQPLLDDTSKRKRVLESHARAASDELQHNMDKSQMEEFKKLNDQLNLFRVDLLGVSSGVDELLAYVDGFPMEFQKVLAGLLRIVEEKRRQVLQWLSVVKFEAHQEEARKLRFEDTGGWLFEKESFGDWVESDCSSIMWLSGKAGSGKTVLSSLVVDTLTATYKSIPTLYFYCYYGEAERRNTLVTINTLLQQLSRRHQKLDQNMVSTFKDAKSLTEESSAKLFADALSRWEKAFIVVDALDECSEEQRRSMVQIFTRQLRTGPGRCKVKIFLTSRFEDDLLRLLDGYPSHRIAVEDTTKDIRPFVTETVNNLIQQKRLLPGQIVTDSLKEYLIQTLNEKADGMFLWVKLQLDYICKQGTEKEVKDQLERLPSGLKATYERIWTRIVGAESDTTERKWTLRALRWILYAKTPLDPKTLLAATAFEQENPSFDPASCVSLDYLIRVCGNFIALDEELGVVRFVHYSVQEFLREQSNIQSGEGVLGEICLMALSHGQSSVDLRKYAMRHWPDLVRYWEEINEVRDRLIAGFLLNEQCVREWFQFCKDRGINDFPQYIGSDEHCALTPDGVASYFNLPVILQHFVHKDLPISRISLDIACSKDNPIIVQILLGAGADVNAQGGEYGTALIAAARHSSSESLKLLLGVGADVNAPGGKYGTALIAAAYRDSETAVKLLLGAGVDVNAQVGGYGTVLIAAAYWGSMTAVKLLLGAGADVNAQGGEHGTALIAAAYRDSETAVKLLLGAGADVNAQGGKYGTALIAAAYRNSETAVKLLLDAGADVNAPSCAEYDTALIAAAANSSGGAVKLLLGAGADVNAQWGRGTALVAGVRNGSVEVVRLVTNTDAVNIHTGDYQAVLLTAAVYGHQAITELLLEATANVTVKNQAKQTSLDLYLDAWIRGLIIGAGNYPDKISSSSPIAENPPGIAAKPALLHIAARIGNHSILRRLLELGANPNEIDEHGWTPLLVALNYGESAIVDTLKSHGADFEEPDVRESDYSVGDPPALWFNFTKSLDILISETGLGLRCASGCTPSYCCLEMTRTC